MLRVGITGGIASGKSTVAEMLAARGAHVLAADGLAHQLYAPGTGVYDEIVFRFGRAILNTDGTVERKKLADAVFPSRVAELNAIVHPAVIEVQKRWMAAMERADPCGIAVVEAALILEAGAEKDFDKIIVVTCSFEQKIQRYATRLGMSLDLARAEVERRSAAQLSDEAKARRADYVIENSGSLHQLEEQVRILWQELQALAPSADRAP